MKKANLLAVQANKAYNGYGADSIYAEVAGWRLTVEQDEKADWNYYSKGWHKIWGPKRTIENWRVVFQKGTEKKVYRVESFSGNYLLRAIKAVLNPPKPDNKPAKQRLGKYFNRVQLNELFEVRFIRAFEGIEFYSLSILGSTVLHCAFMARTGEHYHAETLQGAVAGLKRKRKEHIAHESQIIDKDTAEELGFCHFGILQFCDDNDISINSRFTRAELRKIVLKNKKLNCDKYAAELRKIGINLNCE
ncbi:MAG TPA: hypothetical protein PKD70_06340 [Saprospiraceae bacterium]|nr:hypothetical protein [Saprospiraceae bacterium]HMP13477.1 hypothetical protein [Saprospiraceae bacterium]